MTDLLGRPSKAVDAEAAPATEAGGETPR